MSLKALIADIWTDMMYYRQIIYTTRPLEMQLYIINIILPAYTLSKMQ